MMMMNINNNYVWYSQIAYPLNNYIYLISLGNVGCSRDIVKETRGVWEISCDTGGTLPSARQTNCGRDKHIL